MNTLLVRMNVSHSRAQYTGGDAHCVKNVCVAASSSGAKTGFQTQIAGSGLGELDHLVVFNKPISIVHMIDGNIYGRPEVRGRLVESVHHVLYLAPKLH